MCYEVAVRERGSPSSTRASWIGKTLYGHSRLQIRSTVRTHPSPYSKRVWPICGQNFRHATGNACQKMITNLKPRNWWLQLLKRQKLKFSPYLRFGTVRSVVRIHSPRPEFLRKI